MGRGRHPIDDTASLEKMAEGFVEGKFTSAWEAASALAKVAGGASVESTRKRLATKFLRTQEFLLKTARQAKEDEDDEAGVFGVSNQRYRDLARYLVSLPNEKRAEFIAKFLIAKRERRELDALVRRKCSKKKHRWTMDDEVFLITILGEIEYEDLGWDEIHSKLEKIDKADKSTETID